MSGPQAPAAAEVVAMPAVSEGMEEGTILRWLVADGAEVAAGEAVVEIETDKAATELEAPQSGRVWRVADEGDTLPVGAPLATIGAERVATSMPPHAGPATPEADPSSRPAPARESAGVPAGRRISSPLARRLAREHGVALEALDGSGPRGRIVRADVLRHVAAAAPRTDASAPASPASPGLATPSGSDGAGARGTVTPVEPSRVQTVIARRMAESRATVPTFDVAMDVDMTEAVELRRRVRALTGGTPTSAPSLNDMVVKACGLALRRFPAVNGSYVDGAFELYERVNVGIAVASEDALLVPTIFDADRRSLGEIAATTRALVARARDGAVTPPELAGGTFTVSNLGMFGVTHFTAVVNQPQAAILAVGQVASAAVEVDGAIVLRPRMTLTLSSDHRILYGADAARFLGAVRDLLEAPLALMVG